MVLDSVACDTVSFSENHVFIVILYMKNSLLYMCNPPQIDLIQNN